VAAELCAGITTETRGTAVLLTQIGVVMDVVVAGQGYVGLPLAVRAAEVGHRVVGYDVNPDRIKRLTAGDSYVEDVASSRLRAVLDTGAYSATADADALAGFDIAVITVPTPLRDGVPDLTYIESCARTLGGRLRPGATVVLESTTYPGTTEELLVPILEKASGLKAGVDFLAGFSPERIAPGNNKRWSFDGTPKVVSGIDARSLDAIKGFYDGIFQTTVPVSGPKVAEMAKLIENVFRFVNISLVNEMAMLAAPLGVNIWEAIDAAATKPFGFMRFDPGPGMGGHCLPVDPFYLAFKAREHDFYPEFVELAGKVNQAQPEFCVQRIERALNKFGKPVKGSKILILGASYKPGIGDTRESPALRIIALLRDLGAEISYHDPFVPELPDQGLKSVDLDEGLAAADLLAIVTAHPGVDHEAAVKAVPLAIDFRGISRKFDDPDDVERL